MKRTSEDRRGRKILTAISALMLAATGVAQTDTVEHAHAGKKGTLKVLSTTEVAGVTLQAGDYEVKDVKSPSGDSIEFTHVWQNDFPLEAVSPYEHDVVATVRATAHPLSTESKHTELMFASSTAKAVGVEIRGENVDYLF